MSCVIACIDNDKITIGIDSFSESNDRIFIKKENKQIFGTLTLKMKQILQHQFDPPKRKKSESLFQYLSTVWLDSLKVSLISWGYYFNSGTLGYERSFLFGIEKSLFYIDNDLKIYKIESKYKAIGNGKEYAYAMGSLFTSQEHEIFDSQKCVLISLKCLSKFDKNVLYPYHIVSMKF